MNCRGPKPRATILQRALDSRFRRDGGFMRTHATPVMALMGVMAIAPAVSSPQQPPGKAWTQEEMFRRNVGTREDQRTQFPPHKIVGNLYYVGTRSLASFLVATSQGLILINTNYE